MSTNIFQQETGKFLKTYFPVAERLDDALLNKFGTYQVSKKPYDFFGCTKNGIYWCAEAKKVILERFPIRNIETHQRESLAKVSDNNGLSFLFINWRYKLSGEAIWITFNEYCEIEYELLSKNRKSLTPNDFDENWFLVRKNPTWIVPPNHYLYNLI